MNVGMYTGASGLAAYEKWQEVISQNLSVSSVPGFKKSGVTFSVEQAGETGLGSQNNLNNMVSGSMPKAHVKTIFMQGELHQSGNDLDFAIQGPGFFKVERAGGGAGYTRDGEFHLSADRTIVNKQGMPVMGESGPLALKAGFSGPVSINEEGMVSQGGETIGKLPIFDFKDPQKLRRDTDGLLTPEANQESQQIEKPVIVSGFTEGSNVSPLQEMVDLITVSRAYEACQKVITTNDQNVDKAIQTLGSTS